MWLMKSKMGHLLGQRIGENWGAEDMNTSTQVCPKSEKLYIKGLCRFKTGNASAPRLFLL